VHEVIVVGGGLTGLVTANALTRRGISCVVLEAEERVGGRIGTMSFGDGATAESGMEEFWEASPAIALLRRLDLPLVEHPAHSSVIIRGHLHRYPIAAGIEAYLGDLFGHADRAAFAMWNNAAGDVLDELACATRSGRWGADLATLRTTSFRSFVGRLRLPARVRAWIRIVVESETAVEWHRIAALDGIDEMRAFVVDGDRRHAGRCVRVEGGNERLVDALMSELPGHTVRLHARVRRVVDHGSATGVEVVYDGHGGRRHVERGRHVVLTPPLWALRHVALEPVLDPLSRTAIASLGAGSYVKVVLRLRSDRVDISERGGEHPFPLLTDGPAGCVYLSDGRPSGRDHVLTMLIHGSHARELNGLPSEVIVDRAQRALDRLVVRSAAHGLTTPLLGDARAATVDAQVFDHPSAVPFWPVALGRSRFDQMSDALRAPHGRVLIGGDSTDNSHSDGAVRAGQRMAALLLERVGRHAGTSAFAHDEVCS
jgi:monoamine oxidase